MNSTYYSLYWSIPQNYVLHHFLMGWEMKMMCVTDPQFCRMIVPTRLLQIPMVWSSSLLTADMEFRRCHPAFLASSWCHSKARFGLSSTRSQHLLTKEFNRNDGQDWTRTLLPFLCVTKSMQMVMDQFYHHIFLPTSMLIAIVLHCTLIVQTICWLHPRIKQYPLFLIKEYLTSIRGSSFRLRLMPQQNFHYFEVSSQHNTFALSTLKFLPSSWRVVQHFHSQLSFPSNLWVPLPLRPRPTRPHEHLQQLLSTSSLNRVGSS